MSAGSPEITEKHLNDALKINPNDAFIYALYSSNYFRKRTVEFIPMLIKAIELDKTYIEWAAIYESMHKRERNVLIEKTNQFTQEDKSNPRLKIYIASHLQNIEAYNDILKILELLIAVRDK